MKALLFNDNKMFLLIMNANKPKYQKLYGRRIKGFNKKIWEKYAPKIVFRGNMAKFTQNKNLKDILLTTTGTTLVEASPYDKIWGIGLSENDPLAQDRATWKGTNWLGQILTLVRKEIEKNYDPKTL
jgi:ribA/ribD-fused uncharacterized protein